MKSMKSMNKVFVFVFVFAIALVFASSAASAAILSCDMLEPDSGSYSGTDYLSYGYSVTPGVGVNWTNLTLHYATGISASSLVNESLFVDAKTDIGEGLDQEAFFSSVITPITFDPGAYYMTIECCGFRLADSFQECVSSDSGSRSWTVSGASMMSSLTRTMLSLLIGFIALAILGFAIIGIGIHLKNNFAEMDHKQFIMYCIMLLIIVVLGIIVMQYTTQQLSLTWNPSTNVVFDPASPLIPPLPHPH